MKHHLTYKDEKSDKFWQIEVNGNEHTVTYGKTGTNGSSKTKAFDSEEACLKDATKALNGKLKKGYVELGASNDNGVAHVVEQPKAAKEKTKSPSTKQEVLPTAEVLDAKAIQIQDLLLSKEDNNISMALEMIKAENSTDKLREELFVTYQFTWDKTIKNTISALIEATKDEPLKEAISKKYGFTSASEKKVNEYIKNICPKVNFDKSRFAYAIFMKTDLFSDDESEDDSYGNPIRGLYYLFQEGSPALKKKLLKNFIEGDTFSIDWDSKLIHIPEEILDFKEIKKVVISSPISSIPKTIVKMSFIKELELNASDLEKLPKGISGLKELEKLVINYTEIEELPEELAQLKKLHTLDISGHAFEEFPEVITEITSLKNLAISNKFKFIPEEITHLKNLEKLKFVADYFDEFPENICELDGLKSLSIEGMMKIQLPNAITGLTNLKHLGIVGCGKETNLSVIKELTKLESITLRTGFFNETFTPSDKLAVPMDIVEYLPSGLKRISLDLNFEQFPTQLITFDALEELHISNFKYEGERIPELPKEINQLKQLKKLTLMSNSLSEIPKELSELKNLSYLNIHAFEEFNKITSLPEAIEQLPNLRELVISDHQFEVFKDKLKGLPIKKITVLSSDIEEFNREEIQAALPEDCELFLTENDRVVIKVIE